MRVINEGHTYELKNLDGDGSQILSFVDRGHGRDCEGTTCQEVIKALIDRVIFLNNELPSEFNKSILMHARMMLINFEARALCRKVEKGELHPEHLSINSDDLHIKLTVNNQEG